MRFLARTSSTSLRFSVSVLCSGVLLGAVSLLALTGQMLQAEEPVAPGDQVSPVATSYLLSPSEQNPRNSEGAFLPLTDGRLMFIYTHFTGGAGDHAAAHLAARFSSDGGQTWTEQDMMILPNEAGCNVMSVSLVRLPDQRIGLFYLRKNSLQDCRPFLRYSSDEGATWSDPVTIIPDSEVGYYVLNNDRVVQLDSGRLIAPVACHNRADWERYSENAEISCYLSDDSGKTWRRSQWAFHEPTLDAQPITLQEPGVVELAPDQLLMFIRTGSNCQFLSNSTDGGETWTTPRVSSIRSPRSPASIKRIPSTGELLLIWNNNTQTTGPRPTLRTPLSLATSGDNGQTWSEPLDLETDPHGWYCYTAIHFEPDHVVLGYCAGDSRGDGLATTKLVTVPLAAFASEQ